MICARKCRATFTRASFQKSSLLVFDQANVTLIFPQFSRFVNRVSMPGVSLFVNGTDCEVFVDGGCIERGTHGVAMREGGFLECYRTDIISAEEVEAEVRGERSRLKFDRCSVYKVAFPENHRAAVGLHGHAGAEARVYRSSLEYCRGSSVCVKGGYCLLDYTIKGQSGLGVLAKGEDSSVYSDNNSLKHNVNPYVAVEEATVEGRLLHEYPHS